MIWFHWTSSSSEKGKWHTSPYIHTISLLTSVFPNQQSTGETPSIQLLLLPGVSVPTKAAWRQSVLLKTMRCIACSTWDMWDTAGCNGNSNLVQLTHAMVRLSRHRAGRDLKLLLHSPLLVQAWSGFSDYVCLDVWQMKNSRMVIHSLLHSFNVF